MSDEQIEKFIDYWLPAQGEIDDLRELGMLHKAECDQLRADLAAAQRTISTLGEEAVERQGRLDEAERLLDKARMQDVDVSVIDAIDTFLAPSSSATTDAPMCYRTTCRYYGQRHATPHEEPETAASEPAQASAQGTTDMEPGSAAWANWITGRVEALLDEWNERSMRPTVLEKLDKRVAALETWASSPWQGAVPKFVKPASPQPALAERHTFVPDVRFGAHGPVEIDMCQHPGCGGQPRSAAVHATCPLVSCRKPACTGEHEIGVPVENRK